MDSNAPLPQIADMQNARYNVAPHIVKYQYFPDRLPGLSEDGRIGRGQAGDVCIVGVGVLGRGIEIEDALNRGWRHTSQRTIASQERTLWSAG
jgi:hypothetical protein